MLLLQTFKSRRNSVCWTTESTGINLRLILKQRFTTFWETWKIGKKVNYSFKFINYNGYNYIVLGIRMNPETSAHAMACPFSLNKNCSLGCVHCKAIKPFMDRTYKSHSVERHPVWGQMDGQVTSLLSCIVHQCKTSASAARQAFT